MNGNHKLNAPIDYDAYKARAQSLRRQVIDRLLDRFSAWLTDIAGKAFRRNRVPARPVMVARC